MTVTQRSWRGLVGVLTAQAMAWTGTRLLAVALPWFVLTTTDSAARTGMVVFAQMAPFVVAQVLSGPIIDRVGPRRVSITGDLVAATALGMIPLLYALDVLSFAALLALMAVVGAADGPSTAAKLVFTPEVTKAAGVPLERGTGLTGTIERLASTIGPAIAGVVVAAIGGVYTLSITAALLALGAGLIAWVAPRRVRTVEPERARSGYVRELREGASFLNQDRLLRSIIGMVAVTNLLDAAWMSVLLPVWARDQGYGPETVGLVLGVLSGFSILASLFAAVVGHRLPRRLTYLVGFLVAGAPRFVVLALGAPLWLVVAVHAVGGLGSGVINPILGAIQFERIPAALLGRVKTLSMALAWAGMPFGAMVGGAMVTIAGLVPALLVGGAGYLIATTLPGLRPEWAEMDHNRRADEAEPAAGPSA